MANYSTCHFWYHKHSIRRLSNLISKLSKVAENTQKKISSNELSKKQIGKPNPFQSIHNIRNTYE